jgi:Tol biopolymer transport system component
VAALLVVAPPAAADPACAIDQLTEGGERSSRLPVPAVSDDGERVTFGSDEDLTGGNPDRNLELFVYERTPGSWRQLTNTSGADGISEIGVDISGDGTSVVFASAHGDLAGPVPGVGTRVYVVDVATGATDEVSDGVVDVAADAPRIDQDGDVVAWSSTTTTTVLDLDTDGATEVTGRLRDLSGSGQVVATVGGGTGFEPMAHLYRTDLVAASQSQVEELVFAAFPAALDHTGDHLAYSTHAATAVYDATTEDTAIAASAASVPSISNDGTVVGYASPDQVVVVPADGLGAPTVVREWPQNGIYRAVVTGDATAVAYVGGDGSRVFVEDVAGNDDPQQASLGSFDGVHRAAPDATAEEIVFTSGQDLVGQNADRSHELYLWSAGSSTVEQLTDSSGGLSGDLRFAASGALATFVSDADLTGGNADRSSEVFTYDTTDDSVAQITDETAADLTVHDVDADGTTVLFSRRELGEGSQLHLWDTAAEVATAIITPGNDDWSPRAALSGDGTTVATWSTADLTGGNPGGVRQLFRYDIGSETFEQVTAVTADAEPAGISLSHDGALLAFANRAPIIDPNPSGDARVYLQESGGPIVEGAGGRQAMAPQLSASGTRLAFSGAVSSTDTVLRSLVMGTEATFGGTEQERLAAGGSAFAAVGFTQASGGHELQRVRCSTFADVHPDSPFNDDIAWAADNSITTGYPDGTFRPGAPVTRQAMAAFLYRLAGADHEPPTTAPFTDVPATHPFATEIDWAADQDITTGYPDGTYRPSNPVTRQTAAAFLHRYADGP